MSLYIDSEICIFLYSRAPLFWIILLVSPNFFSFSSIYFCKFVKASLSLQSCWDKFKVFNKVVNFYVRFYAAFVYPLFMKPICAFNVLCSSENYFMDYFTVSMTFIIFLVPKSSSKIFLRLVLSEKGHKESS